MDQNIKPLLLITMTHTEKKYYASFSQIVPHLFLGNSDTAYDPEILDIIGVSHILVMGTELEMKYQGKYVYKKINIDDSIGANLLQYLQEGYDFIEEGLKGKGVLVHCRFGISRSSAMVIAYLMKSKKQSFLKSYNQVKNKRQIIKPNKGFIRQLNNYESRLQIPN